MSEITCIIDGCDKPRYGKRRMCNTHAMRKHRYGDPLVDKTRTGRAWSTDNGYIKGATSIEAIAHIDGSCHVHREVLYRATEGKPQSCHWCGTTVEWKAFTGRSWQGVLVVDHLDGDKQNNALSNLVPSCFSCNALRGRWGDEAVRKRRARTAAAHAS